MRKKELEITDQKIIDQIIANSTFCHMALSDGNQPYIVPVNFGRKENSIYIHAAYEGRKIDILKKNNNVCLLFEVEQELENKGKEACKWGTKYRSVMGFGKAYLVTDDLEKRKGLVALMTQYYDGEIELNKKSTDRCLIIRVDIDSFTGKSSGY
ncbi:MAG: pyridoxamine 5'-phosphate oxidase family protein [candidate division Zixibacteria bacterium]|nr:pyridoxamine 5'-phosphate oxidase family protein [candidate division Zixibacteria bacterium]